MSDLTLRIGTAGWSIPRATADKVPGEGSHLQRYSRSLNCAEINTSFYRSHTSQVYERWAAQTPASFRFAVKAPRLITHENRLLRSRTALRTFLAEISGLGDRLGIVLVQLPPSLVFDARVARNFFSLFRSEEFFKPVVVEPRHKSWFGPAADRTLETLQISRVAADPAPVPLSATPGGWQGENASGAGAVRYYRWHGSPRMYWSDYADIWLEEQAKKISTVRSSQAETWCVFDNTAGGQALKKCNVSTGNV